MDKTGKNALLTAGIIIGLVLLFRYIIPVIFRALGWLAGTILQIALWAAIGFFVIILAGNIIKIVKNR